MSILNVVLWKPSKYDEDGFVEYFRRGFLPNATLDYIASMTPAQINGWTVRVTRIDEYVQRDLRHHELLRNPGGERTLVAFVGVQSHQMHRAADMAAMASKNGCMTVIGGPHPMTCDTTMLQGKGVSFALSEAEVVWQGILDDATLIGELSPVYGSDRRWATEDEMNERAPVLTPPSREALRRYIFPMVGSYPVRGCPFTCDFCSVIKIAGRNVRAQPVERTMAGLRNAKAGGARMIIFTSDNFNKFQEAGQLLEAMIRENLGLKFFAQCDVQIADQPELVKQMGEAGCHVIFVGVESFSRKTLLKVHKTQNHPDKYRKIVDLCNQNGIVSHFSNIIGFEDDTEASVHEHVERLIDSHPLRVSGYVLCPIPGTEQYQDFKSRGLINEKNLDRFDATYPTWQHPHLSKDDRRRLFQYFYRRYYSVGHTLQQFKLIWRRNDSSRQKRIRSMISYAVFAAFARYSVSRGYHPMAGGFYRFRLDNVSTYSQLRRETYGFDLFPLPDNLKLAAAEQHLNDHAKLYKLG